MSTADTPRRRHRATTVLLVGLAGVLLLPAALHVRGAAASVGGTDGRLDPSSVGTVLAPGDALRTDLPLDPALLPGSGRLLLRAELSGPGALTGTGPSALRATATGCTTVWTDDGCAGSAVVLLADLPVGVLTDLPPVAAPAGGAPLTSLRVDVHVPDRDEHSTDGVLPPGSAQGQELRLGWVADVLPQ